MISSAISNGSKVHVSIYIPPYSQSVIPKNNDDIYKWAIGLNNVTITETE